MNIGEEYEVKEEITTVGCCRYCGQSCADTYAIDGTQEEKDEIATENCTCTKAKIYARHKKEIENAKKNIRSLFGEGAEDHGLHPLNSEKVLSLLDEIAELISYRHIGAVALTLTGTLKAKLTATSDGNIRVERIDTEKNKLE